MARVREVSADVNVVEVRVEEGTAQENGIAEGRDQWTCLLAPGAGIGTGVTWSYGKWSR